MQVIFIIHGQTLKVAAIAVMLGSECLAWQNAGQAYTSYQFTHSWNDTRKVYSMSLYTLISPEIWYLLPNGVTFSPSYLLIKHEHSISVIIITY